MEKEKEKQQIKVTRVSKESTPEGMYVWMYVHCTYICSCYTIMVLNCFYNVTEEDKLDDKVTLRRRRGGSGGSADYKQPMKKK